MDNEILVALGIAILSAFGGVVIYLIKKNVDIYFDKKRIVEIQTLVDAGKVSFPVNIKGETTESIAKGVLVEVRENQFQEARQAIVPKWLIYSLISLYSFYLLNSTMGAFFGTSLMRIIRGAGEFGQIINWIIYELKTGLTLWFFFCLYRGLNQLSGYLNKKQPVENET